MCYSVIDQCGYWTSGTLPTLASTGNTLYNVMGVKRHITPVDWCVCWNLAERKSLLKMCISKHCHEVTGFLSWIGTYCISCVVQQRSRVKDLPFIVGYDESLVDC